MFFFFFSSRRRHTRCSRDWSSDVCSSDLKREWLPRITSGEALGCFCLTEPGTGSDAGNLETKAVRDGDGWRLSGTKMFITNGTWAGIALVFARTGGEGPRGVSAFLVPTNSEGFVATEIKGKLGLRSGDTAEVTL